jgi:hypothetical protein
MKSLIDDVLHHIKAFDGDVYGGVVRDYRTVGVVYVKDINCRLDNNILHIFIQTLNLYYHVEEISFEIGGTFAEFRKKIKVSRKEEDIDKLLYSSNSPQLYVYLDIVLMTRIEWMRVPCDFDVNTLAENSHSMFIRVPYASLNRYSDRLNHIVERIKDMSFCSVEDCHVKTPEQITTLVDRALRLVMRGWIMDDLLLGDKTWVIASWHILSNQLRMVRKNNNKDKYDKMISMKECAICNEEFKKTDIVINTKCNHNFHWSEFCNTCVNHRSYSASSSAVSGKCKGLKEWVKRGNITCPICRQIMF